MKNIFGEKWSVLCIVLITIFIAGCKGGGEIQFRDLERIAEEGIKLPEGKLPEAAPSELPAAEGEQGVVEPSLPACAKLFPSKADLYMIMNYKAHADFPVTPESFADDNYGCSEPPDLFQFLLSGAGWLAGADKLQSQADLVKALSGLIDIVPSAACVSCTFKPIFTSIDAEANLDQPPPTIVHIPDDCSEIFIAYTFDDRSLLQNIAPYHFVSNAGPTVSINVSDDTLVTTSLGEGYSRGLDDFTRKQLISFGPNVFYLALFMTGSPEFPLENRILDVLRYYTAAPLMPKYLGNIFLKLDVNFKGTEAAAAVYDKEEKLIASWMMRNDPAVLKVGLDKKRYADNRPCGKEETSRPAPPVMKPIPAGSSSDVAMPTGEEEPSVPPGTPAGTPTVIIRPSAIIPPITIPKVTRPGPISVSPITTTAPKRFSAVPIPECIGYDGTCSTNTECCARLSCIASKCCVPVKEKCDDTSLKCCSGLTCSYGICLTELL